ncbi:MAG: Ku protein [Myxococcota bacterium]
MAARAMWKGVVSLDGELRVPVRMYSALEDVKVHFRLLHGDDKEPVRQEMVDPDTEEPVPTEDRRKALEVEPVVGVDPPRPRCAERASSACC